MILNSGDTNITNVSAFELGNNYSKFDIVYYSGYTNSGTEYLAAQSASGHYYYTGAAATSAASNLPTVTNSPWTNKFFAEVSYGASVEFKNKYYEINYGDGYFNYLNKSENSIKSSFNLPLSKRSDKESKAIIHLLEDSFNKGAKPSGGYSGIYWTPFAPYDQELEFFVESFSNNLEYPNVNSVGLALHNEDRSTTDWKDFYIPFSNTSGFWAVGNSYSEDDIIYGSGSDFTPATSGWYYYSGGSEVVATDDNGPIGNNSLWTKKHFYWPLNKGISFNESPRFFKQSFQNDFVVRVEDGLNKSLLKLNINLTSRTDKQAKAILHFLEKHRGYDQFLFTPPSPYNETKPFLCTEWKHTIKFKDNNDISIMLQEQPIDYTSYEIEFLNLITVDPFLS